MRNAPKASKPDHDIVKQRRSADLYARVSATDRQLLAFASVPDRYSQDGRQAVRG
jgi:hypothetical protein